MAKVGIIIPLFNKCKYITRALNSVFAQTYKDFEVIVVDDGSTDNGPEIIKKYNDSRLYLIQQKNTGPGSARNRGIKETTAPYLTFLDADDEWMPNFLYRYLNALIMNPACDYAVGSYIEGHLRRDRSIIWKNLNIKEGPWQLPKNISHTDLQIYLTELHSSCTIMCKRDIVIRYGGFYSGNKCICGEDRYLQIQLLLNHKFYCIVEPLTWYHVETEGISTITPLNTLPPILTDPEPIRTNCPNHHRNALEKYLASKALNYANKFADYNNRQIAIYLVKQFPLMKKWFRKYIKLWVKIYFPQLFVVFDLYTKMKKRINNGINN